jgi:hydroxymethylbilane synthase
MMTVLRKVKIGTRGSKLALWQTELVLTKLKASAPETVFEQVVIKTKGDKILDVALSRIGDKGLFTKEIENEIRNGRIDLAVHSMKDLPTVLPSGLIIGAVLARDNPNDILLTRDGSRLKDMKPGSMVGTSSLRRRAQLLSQRPDLEVMELRGNVDSRIRRLIKGDFEGMILARAGVARLGYEDMISEDLSFLPAVGQGAIGIETRAGDSEILDLIGRLDDANTRHEVEAERAFLFTLEGGCQIPVAALAAVNKDTLVIEGLVSDLDGTRVYRDTMTGPVLQAEALGRQLAERLLARGAGEVLDEIRKAGELP